MTEQIDSQDKLDKLDPIDTLDQLDVLLEKNINRSILLENTIKDLRNELADAKKTIEKLKDINADIRKEVMRETKRHMEKNHL